MAKRNRKRTAPRSGPARPTSFLGWLPVVAVVAAAAGLLVISQLRADPARFGSGASGSAPTGSASSGQGRPVAWSRLGSEDVHSLSFVAGDPQRLLFGHHGGLSTTSDGGRTWQALPVREDAMAISAVGPTSIVIAGHEVLSASSDGGRTWAPLAADLPSKDIHGFTRDPANPDRMWAVVAGKGLWQTADGGRTWELVRADAVLNPVAVTVDGTTRLLAVDATGLIASTDGGRTWAPLATPPTYPMTALVVADGGTVLYAGSPSGLYRSDDGGRSWRETAYRGSVMALATTSGGKVVAIVDQETRFFRSDDAGATFPGPG